MKRLLQFASVLGVAGGMFFLSGTSAKAVSVMYSSPARSQSVRLVWRKSMGQHAFTRAQGGRYSKHLGLLYAMGYEEPGEIWFTDAHEKLYRKAKGTSAIYYHVQNAAGTHKGWIWRGYLKPTTTTQTPAVVSAKMSRDQTLKTQQNIALQKMTAKQVQTAVAQRLASQYTFNQKMMAFAQYMTYADDGINGLTPDRSKVWQPAKFGIKGNKHLIGDGSLNAIEDMDLGWMQTLPVNDQGGNYLIDGLTAKVATALQYMAKTHNARDIGFGVTVDPGARLQEGAVNDPQSKNFYLAFSVEYYWQDDHVVNQW
ncbi:hypothetical protein [Levilactobacillus fujinensis]|uniref:D-alanyl-D-alanine carboxypeptidase n=1 Tax=Levilactobacillus fujinensis TaxID=2486024 RepID=A0ABW1TFV7_9LACO|nr:hypothetical protein [Levilactobacillus fujinensis]